MATRKGTRGRRATSSSFDPAVADQLTLQALTAALTQQQLNSAAARSQTANVMNMLTMTVQLNHSAALKQLTQTGPLEAAAVQNLVRAADPQHFAAMHVATETPRG